MITDSHFSACQDYRYAFLQEWDATLPKVMFIGLNPTQMDDNQSNPTLKRCINFAKDWGYGGLYVTNLFARLAATPDLLKQTEQPIGADNDAWLLKLSQECDLVVAAWGNDGNYQNRSANVRHLLPNLHCLKVNQSGEPTHPLYQPKTTQPIAYFVDK